MHNNPEVSRNMRSLIIVGILVRFGQICVDFFVVGRVWITAVDGAKVARKTLLGETVVFRIGCAITNFFGIKHGQDRTAPSLDPYRLKQRDFSVYINFGFRLWLTFQIFLAQLYHDSSSLRTVPTDERKGCAFPRSLTKSRAAPPPFRDSGS